MSYIKHILACVFVIAVSAAAFGQSAVPVRQSDGSWKFTMPAADKLLEVEYDLTLTLEYSATRGSLTVEPVAAPKEFTEIPTAWTGDDTPLSAGDLPGFVSMNEEDALAWIGAPASEVTYLIYGFDGTTGQALVVIFSPGHAPYAFPTSIPRSDVANHPSATLPVDNFYYNGTIGTVTPDASDSKLFHVTSGTEVTVTATPVDAAHHLVDWTKQVGGAAAVDLDGAGSTVAVSTTFQVTDDTKMAADFFAAIPGLTPEGDVTNSGSRFVDEHGDIVTSPRLTPEGDLIEQ